MSLPVILRLGRVSNLPTVWTNVLAGLALAGAGTAPAVTASLIVALSLLYVAGMYLNDAFDRDFDAAERPERPIPSGEADTASVFSVGFVLMGAAIGVLAVTGYVAPGGTGWRAAAAGAILGAVIVYYNMNHKGNPLGPVIMGGCRALVFVIAALAAVSTPPGTVLIGAGAVWSYVIGLSYIARQESLGRVLNLWPLGFLAAPLVYCLPTATSGPVGLVLYAAFAAWVARSIVLLVRRRGADVPRAVVGLIAGLCLLDALLILGAGGGGLVWVAVALFPLTVVAQRFIPGT